jgi:hypothetical protein
MMLLQFACYLFSYVYVLLPAVYFKVRDFILIVLRRAGSRMDKQNIPWAKNIT